MRPSIHLRLSQATERTSQRIHKQRTTNKGTNGASGSSLDVVSGGIPFPSNFPIRPFLDCLITQPLVDAAIHDVRPADTNRRDILTKGVKNKLTGTHTTMQLPPTSSAVGRSSSIGFTSSPPNPPHIISPAIPQQTNIATPQPPPPSSDTTSLWEKPRQPPPIAPSTVQSNGGTSWFDRQRDQRDRDAALRQAEQTGRAGAKNTSSSSSSRFDGDGPASRKATWSTREREPGFEDVEGDERRPSKRQRTQSPQPENPLQAAAAVAGRNPFMTGNDKLEEENAKKHGSNAAREAAMKRQRDEATAASSTGVKSLGGKVRSKFTPPYRKDDNSSSNVSSVSGSLTPALRAALAGPNGREGETHEKLRGLDPKLIEMIMNEMLESPGIEWKDIAGLEFAKRSVREIVVWPILRPELFTGLRGPPKGLLLFGPPGTGKTLVGKAIASESKSRFFSISASSLTSKWHGEGEKLVRTLFAVAQVYEPSIIFIDEIDSLLSQRNESEFEASRRIKTEFLIQLDGAGTTGKERVLVVGATNRPQELDEAARRRLVKKLYIPLPDYASRMQLLRNLMAKQGVDHRLTEADFHTIVTRADGYSGSDMSSLCTEAAMGPIRDMSSMMSDETEITSINAAQVRPITLADFDVAFHSIRPSVHQKDLEAYVAWNKQYGSFPMTPTSQGSADAVPAPSALARQSPTIGAGTSSPTPVTTNMETDRN